MQLLSDHEEKQIKQILDKAVQLYDLSSTRKEKMLADGMVIDRLWTVKMRIFQEIPVIGFEIEKGIPSNERLRKDIMNIVYSKAPVGYVIIPHSRIMKFEGKGNPSVTWYKNGTFYRDFQSYCKIFANVDIRLVDADVILSNESYILSAEMWIPYLTEDDFKRTT